MIEYLSLVTPKLTVRGEISEIIRLEVACWLGYNMMCSNAFDWSIGALKMANVNLDDAKAHLPEIISGLNPGEQ